VHQSISVFELGGTALNFSIAHCHLSLVALLQDRPEKAWKEILISKQYAEQMDFKRGLAAAALIQGQIKAQQNEVAKAQSLMQKGLAQFASLQIEEGLNYEIAGRTCRYLKDFSQAEQFLEKGLQISEAFPMYHAALYVEQAKLFQIQNRNEWKESYHRAFDIYERCQCDLRLEQLTSQFRVT